MHGIASAGNGTAENSDQAMKTGDALLIEVLRGDNRVLDSHNHSSGAWTGRQAFTPAFFAYKGDGSGNVHLRIEPAKTRNSGRFLGVIDNIVVREAR